MGRVSLVPVHLEVPRLTYGADEIAGLKEELKALVQKKIEAEKLLREEQQGKGRIEAEKSAKKGWW